MRQRQIDAAQGKAGQGRAGQGRARQGKAEQSRSRQGRAERTTSHHSTAHQGRAEHKGIWLGRAGTQEKGNGSTGRKGKSWKYIEINEGRCLTVCASIIPSPPLPSPPLPSLPCCCCCCSVQREAHSRLIVLVNSTVRLYLLLYISQSRIEQSRAVCCRHYYYDCNHYHFYLVFERFSSQWLYSFYSPSLSFSPFLRSSSALGSIDRCKWPHCQFEISIQTWHSI